MRLLVLTLTVLFEMSSGTDLCSISETDVACYPCSMVCPEREEMCFRCPDGCGGDCRSTCGDTCLHGECHYTDTAQLQCSHGCNEGWAGIFCQEGCPPNCVLCDQFNSTCLSCVEGYQGDRCTHITTKEAEHSPDTGTTTSEHETTQGTTDLYPSSLWQGINIVIGLAVAVVLLLICSATVYKLYKVHGSLKRDTEVAIDQPVPARPVQVAIVDDDRESGIYSYIVVKGNC